MYKKIMADRLKKMRKQKGYTQQEVSELTNIPRVTISRIEIGERNPDIDTLGTLIDFYETNADWILGTGKKTKGDIE